MTSAGSRMLGPAEVRQLATRLDVRPTKQRGQNFVIDPNTVRRIVREAGLHPDDVVVEVGPGLGSLTLALLENVARVVAIELLPSLERGLVMVQSEVADRLAAGPGSKVYGVPSVKAGWYADVRRAGAVGRNVFWPAPNVDSGLVAWTRREAPLTTATREQVFAVIDAAFAHRRKGLRGALRTLAGSVETASAALESVGIDPLARGESLTVVEFARIAEALS
jgi:16S rRNA (adenine1518-N6/adenine1519-N6)-dimethyltransferase